jgi:hypothetical protein
LQPLLKNTYWNLLSGTGRNVILFSNAFYGVFSDVDRNAANVSNASRSRFSGGLLPPRDRECLPCAEFKCGNKSAAR